jgi:glycosyltransferase involved in cell wall biosynthesis
MISIIIPTYNAEKYLIRCLDSVLNQTYQNFEVICVNDGSKDLSLEILKEFKNKDDRIIIINQENSGRSVARNAGCKLIRGDYVVFLDSDDALPPYALELMHNTAIESCSDIVISDSFLYTSKKIKIPKVNKQWNIHKKPLKEILNNRKSFSVVWNKMYKSSVVKDKKFIEGIYFEDWPYIITLFSQINSYASLKTPCYIYTNDNISTVRSDFSKKKIMDYITGMNYVLDFFKNKDDLYLAKKRVLVAVRMCINKVYRDKKNRSELSTCLINQLNKLARQRGLSFRKLPLKTQYRLWRIRSIAKDIK